MLVLGTTAMTLKLLRLLLQLQLHLPSPLRIAAFALAFM